MTTRLATIIFDIPLSQVENERDFYLYGNLTSSRRAKLSIEILGNLLFININSDLWKPTRKTPPDKLSAPLEPIQDIV